MLCYDVMRVWLVCSRGSKLRMASVNRLAKKLSVLDDNDDIVLNLVAKSNWDQSEPLFLTGSSHKEPESQLYHQIREECEFMLFDHRIVHHLFYIDK